MSREFDQNSSKIHLFSYKIQSLPDMDQEVSYIFYTLFKNLTKMKEKSPWSSFSTHHKYGLEIKHLKNGGHALSMDGNLKRYDLPFVFAYAKKDLFFPGQD